MEPAALREFAESRVALFHTRTGGPCAKAPHFGSKTAKVPSFWTRNKSAKVGHTPPAKLLKSLISGLSALISGLSALISRL